MDRGAWQATAHGVAKSRHNWAAEHKQGPTLIQSDLISKHTITCTKIVFANKVLFVGCGGCNLGIPLGPLLNLLQSGKKKKLNVISSYFYPKQKQTVTTLQKHFIRRTSEFRFSEPLIFLNRPPLLSLRNTSRNWWLCCACPQSCLILCDSMDYNPPGSSVHRISQARILEWVAISSSRGSSWPRNQTCVSCIFCIDRQILLPLSHQGSQELVKGRIIDLGELQTWKYALMISLNSYVVLNQLISTWQENSGRSGGRSGWGPQESSGT